MDNILNGKKENIFFKKSFDKKELFIFCFLITFIWGLIAHAFGFLHSNFCHDSLNAFYASAHEEQIKIELGRFIVPIYRLIRGPVTMPWLIGLLSLIWMSVTVYLIVKIFDIKSNKNIILVSGIMVTNITVTALIATYIFELDFDIFALLMAVLAVYIWKNSGWCKTIFLGAICIMVSIGIYQSYFAVAISLIMFVSIMELLNKKMLSKVIVDDIKALFMVLCGGGLYFVLSKLIYKISGIVPIARTDVFNFEGISEIRTFYIALFKDTYVNFSEYINNVNVYPQYFEILIGIFIPVMVAIIIVDVFLRKDEIKWNSKLFIAFIGLLLPFGTNITYFLARGNGVHDLMTYSIWFIFVMFILLVSWFEKNCNYKYLKNAIKYVSYCLVAIILWQNIILSNMAYLKKDMEAKATYSMMTRVVSKMENENQFEPGITPVAFIGTSNVSKQLPGFDKVSNIVGLGDRSPITYYETYRSYFAYVLNYPLKMCNNKELEELKKNPIVKQMKSYPGNECIKMIDGILVVKMGEM